MVLKALQICKISVSNLYFQTSKSMLKFVIFVPKNPCIVSELEYYSLKNIAKNTFLPDLKDDADLIDENQNTHLNS